jgi:hypothetical protein
MLVRAGADFREFMQEKPVYLHGEMLVSHVQVSDVCSVWWLCHSNTLYYVSLILRKCRYAFRIYLAVTIGWWSSLFQCWVGDEDQVFGNEQVLRCQSCPLGRGRMCLKHKASTRLAGTAGFCQVFWSYGSLEKDILFPQIVFHTYCTRCSTVMDRIFYKSRLSWW